MIESGTSIPNCKALPSGATNWAPGIRLDTLWLEEGFTRISIDSHQILKCYQKEACKGGNKVEEYCGEGYQGPCELVAMRGADR